MQSWFNVYPWDLVDEGLDASLTRLSGDVGVDGIWLTVLRPAVAYLRSRAVYARRRVAVESGAAFQPEVGRYGPSRLRPRPADWCRSRNPLEQICRAAKQIGVKIRLCVCCCDGGLPQDRAAPAACVNAFGDPIEALPCPGNPAVRQYLIALAEDLTQNYEVDAIELRGFDFSPLVAHAAALSVGFTLGPVERVLLGWCFCPACRQRASDAGLDADAVARRVAGRLDAAAAADVPPQHAFTDFLAGADDLAAYARVREQAVSSLIRSIQGRITRPLYLSWPLDRWASGSDLSALADCCDGFVSSLAPSSTARWREALPPAAIAPQRWTLTWSPCPPATPDAPTLVRAVHEANESGYGGLVFDHYGLASDASLDWTRQALRYARREQGR